MKSAYNKIKSRLLKKNVVNIYIVYETNLWKQIHRANFTLINSLFGAVKLTKNDNFDKGKYFRYGIGFDKCGRFRYLMEVGLVKT